MYNSHHERDDYYLNMLPLQNHVHEASQYRYQHQRAEKQHLKYNVRLHRVFEEHEFRDLLGNDRNRFRCFLQKSIYF